MAGDGDSRSHDSSFPQYRLTTPRSSAWSANYSLCNRLTRCISRSRSCLLHRPSQGVANHHHHHRRDPPKGYLPIWIGVHDYRDKEGEKCGCGSQCKGHTERGACDGTVRRYLVKVGQLNHPVIASLLRRTAEEFGYSRRGALQLFCDPQALDDILRLLAIEPALRRRRRRHASA